MALLRSNNSFSGQKRGFNDGNEYKGGINGSKNEPFSKRSRNGPPYPGGRVADGDWLCPSCDNHNFAKRTSCNRCGIPKPPNASPPISKSSRGPRGGTMPYGKTSMIIPNGDWLCTLCDNNNFARRTKCNRCGVPKPQMSDDGSTCVVPAGLGSGYHQGPPPSHLPRPMYDSDWFCHLCNNKNFARRVHCNKCHAPRTSSGNQGGGSMRMYGYNDSTKGPRVASGDWMCPECNNHNFAKRTQCNKCQLPKPDNPEPPNFMGGGSQRTVVTNPNAYHNSSGRRVADGDWMCPKCDNHNFAKRTKCNRCSLDRPSAHGMIH